MTNETLMQNRYGINPKPNRRGVLVLAVALLALFFTWAIWVSFFAPATAKPSVLGYEVKSAESTVVRFSVTKPADRAAICAVEVMNSSFAIVGFKQVTVPASASDSEVFEVAVNTTQLGVTGLVEKCSLN